tara:strand:- start:5419 stop:5802 length:384 start_codon:yes stop_codon:yes gene_type:complete
MDANAVEKMFAGMNISRGRKSTRPSRRPQSLYKPVKSISKPKKPATSKKLATSKKVNLTPIMNEKLKKGNLLSVRQYLHTTKGKTYGLTRENLGVYGRENRFKKGMSQKVLNQILSSASKLKNTHKR